MVFISKIDKYVILFYLKNFFRIFFIVYAILLLTRYTGLLQTGRYAETSFFFQVKYVLYGSFLSLAYIYNILIFIIVSLTIIRLNTAFFFTTAQSFGLSKFRILTPLIISIFVKYTIFIVFITPSLSSVENTFRNMQRNKTLKENNKINIKIDSWFKFKSAKFTYFLKFSHINVTKKNISGIKIVTLKDSKFVRFLKADTAFIENGTLNIIKPFITEPFINTWHSNLNLSLNINLDVEKIKFLFHVSQKDFFGPKELLTLIHYYSLNSTINVNLLKSKLASLFSNYITLLTVIMFAAWSFIHSSRKYGYYFNIIKMSLITLCVMIIDKFLMYLSLNNIYLIHSLTKVTLLVFVTFFYLNRDDNLKIIRKFKQWRKKQIIL